MAHLKDDLIAREGFELRETHISWVFLGERDVFKVKKPVSLGFVDFSSLERRKAACEAEVALNRRLAPDVYRGLRAVVRGPDGTHRLASADADADVVDWAVHMRRLSDADRADNRLAAGRLTPDALRDLAAQVAAFHEAARADAETAKLGAPEAIEHNVRENFAQTSSSIGSYLSEPEAEQLTRWQLGFVRSQREVLVERVRSGRIRDGHGDLRLEHCYLDASGRWQIIDCIEFNDRFRYADVCADVAFLAMDLTRCERPDLAECFLATYARRSGDYALYPLLDFYESYRAVVRAKVASLLADDEGASVETRQEAGIAARRYYLLGLAATQRALAPNVLVAVGGLIASGKSTLAEALAFELAAPTVSSDHTRKRLLGKAPDQPQRDAAFQGAYAPERSETVYATLLRHADAVLRSGRSVVLDASFRKRTQRRAVLELAQRHGVAVLFVECRAPRDVSLARLAERERAPHVSDGRREIYDSFAASWEPVDELPNDAHMEIDTSQPLERNLDSLRARLPVWRHAEG